jgi:DNA topoisomerase-1
VGWDAKGRKPYRYHPLYREVGDQAKFDRLVNVGYALPTIRKAVTADLALSGLPQRKVIATVVRLLETTCIRIGKEEYKRVNGSFGLATLKNRHVSIHGSQLRFRVRGKSGQVHDILMRDTRLARIVRACQCIPGYELFLYKNENGDIHSVRSEDVNRYLFEMSGGHFTAKDFRTWAGTCIMAEFLCNKEPAITKKVLKRMNTECRPRSFGPVGNKPATCRKYYIHPAIVEAFEDGSVRKTWKRYRNSQDALSWNGLNSAESIVMKHLDNEPALLAPNKAEGTTRTVRRPIVRVKTRSGRL